MGTKLERVKQKSAENPGMIFTSLYQFINEELLEQCHRKLDGKKAAGVDRVTKMEYEENLKENPGRLVDRLKRKNYKPQPSLLTYIPKANEKLRPSGIASYEDKLVQYAVKEIMEAVFEQHFMDCMYGFQPGRNCHDAINKHPQQAY